MAEVSYLLHAHDEDDDDRDDDVVVTLDSVPYWSHDFDAFEVFASDPEFPPSDLSLGPQITTVLRRDPDRIEEFSEPDSITTVDLFDRENQVNFVMDLLHQRVEQSSMRVDSDSVSSDPIFGVLEGNDEMGSTRLELDLGLGFGMERHDLGDNCHDHYCGFVNTNCDDEFFVSRRGSVLESGESSTVGSGRDQFAGGLRVVGIVSDSEEDESEIVGVDLNAENNCGLDNACDDLQLCWDSFHLEDHGDGDEDFEWEEVDDRMDEREVLSLFFDADVDEDLDASISTVIPSPEEMGMEREGAMRNLEWEVLLNVNNLETNLHLEHDGEAYLGDQDEYNYTAEYEMLFGQFAENENAVIGKPPTSKTVVENLPLVLLTKEDVANDNALCAVCKDGMSIGEQAKQLPCSHRYHGECIVPWLGIRNTCPVCRYELPTDDPEYERRRTQRAGRLH